MLPSRRMSPINYVFVGFILLAVLFGGFQGSLKEVSEASFEAAKGSVTLAISLIGVMALWLGMVRILEAGGLMRQLGRALRPIMSRLFPGVPAEHPAMSAMLLNISANALGLGNAATPFGLRAMEQLNKLNQNPGTATNAMCLFLAINTSSVTLLPLGVIGVRSAAGSSDPAGIFLPTLLSTIVSTSVAILSAYVFSRWSKDSADEIVSETGPESDLSRDISLEANDDEYEHLRGESSLVARIISWLAPLALLVFAFLHAFGAPSAGAFFREEFSSHWLMPTLMLLMICYGLNRGVQIYEAVTEGAKQGFELAVRIIPFLVAILVAVGVFRASGAMELLASLLNPICSAIGLPAEVLPMALVRPLSGSGAFGIMSAIVERSPDSFEAYLASTLMGSTETTFYVLAVYFGAVGVVRVRHALAAALCADVAGIFSATLFANLLFKAGI